jgi:hypothetical protein
MYVLCNCYVFSVLFVIVRCVPFAVFCALFVYKCVLLPTGVKLMQLNNNNNKGNTVQSSTISSQDQRY